MGRAPSFVSIAIGLFALPLSCAQQHKPVNDVAVKAWAAITDNPGAPHSKTTIMCFQLPDTVIDWGRGLTNWQLRTVSFQKGLLKICLSERRLRATLASPQDSIGPLCTWHQNVFFFFFVITTWLKRASKLVSDFLSDHTPSCSNDKVASSSSSASAPRRLLHCHFLHIMSTTWTQEKMRAADKDALLSSSYLSSCIQLLPPSRSHFHPTEVLCPWSCRVCGIGVLGVFMPVLSCGQALSAITKHASSFQVWKESPYLTYDHEHVSCRAPWPAERPNKHSSGRGAPVVSLAALIANQPRSCTTYTGCKHTFKCVCVWQGA